jgi:signal transduction histidine kinase
VPVVAKAMELGQMRYDQGFEMHQILKEYEILGGILFTFLVEVVDHIDQPCSRSELLACAQRLFRAIALIQQVTATQYTLAAQEQVREREERLRGFNRALSHEIRNRIGAIRNAVEMLREEFVLSSTPLRDRFSSMAVENTQAVERTVENLIALSRTEPSSRQQQNVLLPDVVFEAVRQLRHFAESRGVVVRTAELPRIEVPASVLELALTNYVSNAVKYHDPQKEERWVELRAAVREGELVIEVADNGIGVPEEARDQLFERFYRVHDRLAEHVEGTGLGLSIVREAVESVGGRAWAAFDRPGETVFALSVPSRRSRDRSGPPAAG